MKVRIGIVSFNRRDILVRAIESALAQNYAHKEIVVVDDGSTDDTISLSKTYPEIEWRRNSTNRGLVRARQSLMMEPGHDAYCSLDDDSWFLDPGDLARSVEQLKADPKLGAVAFTIQDRSRTERDSEDVPSPPDVAWFIGCGHLLRSELVRALGGYNDFPGNYGCEEKDLSVRMLDCGYQIKRNARVTVWHDVSFEARNVPALHASGVCNDFVFDLLRCPLPFLAWQIPKKLCSHFLFAIRFACRSTRQLGAHDRRIRQQWGRGVFLFPFLQGLRLFLSHGGLLLDRRTPVSRQTYREFRRLTAFS